MTLSRNRIVGVLGEIFDRRGAEEYLGERVTMSEHMLQAAMTAEREGADEELVAAALLHDVGHFTGAFPADAIGAGLDNRHDQAGAAVLAPHFPARLVACVRWHVAAKRYLCATDQGYFARLSEASVETLRLQGGPMSDQEVAAFRRHPHLDAILRVRRWDDAGKEVGHPTRSYRDYAPLLERLVAARGDEAD